ncbi:hypothetical protein V6N12_048818 [Hibiscus sabdariffa]|uniref:non-specific serine/threonine protein kinase n=1 Tax=Hibiscus sabdariffa TaxID=183260 RepID=A0ABR2EID6_9ROSI
MACFIPLFFLLISASSSQPTELFFPGFKGLNPNNLTLTGVAEIDQHGILRLTNDTSRLQGHAFHSSPFRFKNSPNGQAFSFSTSFVFVSVPEYLKLGGHGLAFTIATSKDLKALPSQYLGILNASDNGNFTNHLVAVEFDTVQDFEFQDINDNHIGIDLNSLTSNASATAAFFTDGGSKQNLTLKSGKPIQAWIDYDSVENVINVTVAPNSTRPRLPILSFRVDLSPFVEEFMYVGFSASTGLLASSHYILGWSFKINGQPQALDLSSLPSLPGPPKKHTALTVGVSVSSVILLILAASVIAYIIFKIRNADVIEDWELEIGPQRYPYEELKKATNGFSEKNLLGQGGFGKVYKGTFRHSKIDVAVKRVSHESKQGLREFVSEIASIGRLRHRNLVQLLGWCRRRAPELPKTGKATTSSDVYAFGALLLEVACGRRPIEPKALPEELVLVDWVWEKFIQGRLLDVADARLNGEYDEGEMLMVLKLGLICSNDMPMARPTMRHVVRYLDGEAELPENLRPPTAFDSNKGYGDGFDAFLNSFASSSFDKMSSNSFMETGNAATSFASLNTSPLSLLRETR